MANIKLDYKYETQVRKILGTKYLLNITKLAAYKLTCKKKMQYSNRGLYFREAKLSLPLSED